MRDKLHYKTTACTLEVPDLKTCPPVTASRPSQSDYSAVARNRDRFVSSLRSFAGHTGCLELNFADSQN